MKTHVLVAGAGLLAGTPAFAHDTFTEAYAPAGYRQELTLQVSHGCKGSPVKEVHVKMPDNVFGVSVSYTRDWKIETKKRTLAQPIKSETGATLTDTVDEIIWKEPASVLPASGMYEGFKFKVALPNTPGQVLWFKAYQVCAQGEDRYIETPKAPLNADMPDFAAKFAAFYRGAEGPAPYVVLVKPEHPQSPLDAARSPKAAK